MAWRKPLCHGCGRKCHPDSRQPGSSGRRAGVCASQEDYRDGQSPCPRRAYSCGSRQVVTVGESAGRSQDPSIPDRRGRKRRPRTSAPKPPSSTTRSPSRCCGRRTRRTQRSIASITKVMTAIVFLENATRPHDAGQIERSDVRARVDDLSARQRRRHAERSAAPAADRLGQRRGPGAGARVAVRLRGLHRADEREGGRTRPRAHALRRIRPACSRQRLVGLRHGAADSPSRPATSASPASCARAA